jgi:hypothetical protein
MPCGPCGPMPCMPNGCDPCPMPGSYMKKC